MQNTIFGKILKERFKVLKKIGQGGWGVVFKGLDLTNANAVAIKQVPLAGIPKEELKSIMNEIKLLQHLKHPKIVTYIDSVQTDNSLFIVLEFIENGSLADITKEFGRFPESIIVLYISQVLEGLHYLHSEGVIHRDIKAANILATKDGGVKVADFGVSTNNANDNASVMGSPYWMAPEIIELNGASPKSDIWSLGCTVIELLTGKPPYYDLDQMPALFRIVQDDCPPLPDGISSMCKDFLTQCFQKEPLLRKSAIELLKHRWIGFHKKKRQQQNQTNVTQTGAPTGPSDVKEEVQAFAILRQRNVEAIKHSGRKRLESAPNPAVPNFRPTEGTPGHHLQPPNPKKLADNNKNNLQVRAASPQHIHTSKKSRKSNKGDSSARRKNRIHSTKEAAQGPSPQVLEVVGNGEDEEWSDYSLKAPKAYNTPERTTPRRPGHARIQSKDLAEWVENGSDDDEEWYEGTIHKNMVNTPLKATAKKKEKGSNKKKKPGVSKKKTPQLDKKKKTDKIRNPDPHLAKQHRRMSSNDLNKWVEYDSEENEDWYESPEPKKIKDALDAAATGPVLAKKVPSDKPPSKKIISPRPKNGRNPDKKSEKPEKTGIPVQKNQTPAKTLQETNEIEDEDDWESEPSLPKIASRSLPVDPGGSDEEDWDAPEQTVTAGKNHKKEKLKKSEKHKKESGTSKKEVLPKSEKGNSVPHTEEISEEDWDKKQELQMEMVEVSDDGDWDSPRLPNGHKGGAGKESEDFKKWSEEKSADSDWENESPIPKIVVPDVTVSDVAGGVPDINFEEEDSDSFDKTPRVKSPRPKTPLPNSPRTKTPRGKAPLKTSSRPAKSPRMKSPRPNTSVAPEQLPEAQKDGEPNLAQYQEKSESDSWGEDEPKPSKKPLDGNIPQQEPKAGVPSNEAGDKANVSLSDYMEEDSWSDLEEGLNDEDANAMVLMSKLNRLKAAPVAPINQEDDPFSDIFSEEEDDFDECDIEENLKKEHLQEVNREITKLVVRILEKDQSEKVVLDSCNTLVEKLREYPGQKGVLIKSEGVIPIIEMLQIEFKNPDVLHAILQVVNEITEDDLQIQKSVRVMGSIPTIIAFWGPMPGQERSEQPNYYPTPIREQTIRFFRNMMERNEKVESSVLRNFIASRALPAVKYLLEPSNNYSSNKIIQRFGVDLMYKILRVKLTSKDTSSLPIKKNDFCRIWARSGLLPSLARALVNFSADKSLRGEEREYVPKISEIILFFSKSDEIVKQLFCAQEVLVPLFTVLDKLQRKPLLDILKAIKDIAQESRTLDAMQKAGAIPRLVSLMSMRETQYDLITDTHTQYILQALFSLCRIVAARQEEAAKEGIIPHLKHFIDTDSTSKQFALPIILEFARAKKTLPFLWENNCVEFYMSLSEQHYPWQVQAVDALATWAAAEPDRVIPIIIQEKHVMSLQSLFKSTQGEAFSTLIEPFQKMVSHYPVARSLILVGFIRTLLDRIIHPNALVRLNLLKVLMSLFSASPDPKSLIEEYNLFDLVKKLEKDHAVLVAEMAGQLKVQFLQQIK